MTPTAEVLGVGDAAPDFELRDQHGSAVTLSRLRGTPVLLVFFPGEREANTYRFLGARDGWNYLAVPILGGEN